MYSAKKRLYIFFFLILLYFVFAFKNCAFSNMQKNNIFKIEVGKNLKINLKIRFVQKKSETYLD